METRFQTSFIPKKPLPSVGGGASMGIGGAMAPQRKPRRSNSMFLNLAVMLFIASLAAGGGVYGWKSVAMSRQQALQDQLAEKQKQFNPDLIEELKRVNIKIDAGNQILRSHLALSNVFDVIGRLTIDRVRFTSLDLTAPAEGSGDIKVSMRGYGAGLSAVAYQSDVLGQLEQYGLRKIVKNPIIANPSQGENGMISFDFSASIDPSSLNYSSDLQTVGGSSDGSSTEQTQ